MTNTAAPTEIFGFVARLVSANKGREFTLTLHSSGCFKFSGDGWVAEGFPESFSLSFYEWGEIICTLDPRMSFPYGPDGAVGLTHYQRQLADLLGYTGSK